jgi:hypothetical protein
MSQFKAGQSGDPKGRPNGALNKATLATQALLDGEAEAPDPEGGGTGQRRPPHGSAALSGPALTPPERAAR